MIKMTAEEIYDKLKNSHRIIGKKGVIKFELAGLTFSLKQRDVVGNVIQEWVKNWLETNGIEFSTNSNSQMPPDFYLSPNDMTKNLLEVKCFNFDAGPGFDIADFNMYQKELIGKPYILDADYLIFGYTMDEQNGLVLIKGVWLKKVWDITRPMKNWALNLQIKKGVVHKIRPGNFYSELPAFPMFKSKEDFLAAIEETVYQNAETHNQASQWRNLFCKAYRQHYHTDIIFPKWNDIKNYYYNCESSNLVRKYTKSVI